MGRVRVPMPPSQRAKIFSMFDALKGLKEALALQEKQPEPRRYLAEDAIADLNNKLKKLETGHIITAVYYCEYSHEYRQLTGPLKKVDLFWNQIEIGNSCIGLSELFDIILPEEIIDN